MANYHLNTLRRAADVRVLAGKYHEPGRHDRSLHVVWRTHVYPVYHISWRTFQIYMSPQMAKELKKLN